MNLLRQITSSLGMTRDLGTLSRPLLQPEVSTRKATFAMACFWKPDSVFGSTEGVIKTRVGYSGGSKLLPTYYDLGDHTESIDIDYDPNKITYDQLLALFWKHHDPTAKTTVQYMSIIFARDSEQLQAAERSKREREKEMRGIRTTVINFDKFYDAEDYHQKYHLQRHAALVKALGLTEKDMADSHVAAKLNGYIVGFGKKEVFDKEWPTWGINQQMADYVSQFIKH